MDCINVLSQVVCGEMVFITVHKTDYVNWLF